MILRSLTLCWVCLIGIAGFSIPVFSAPAETVKKAEMDPKEIMKKLDEIKKDEKEILKQLGEIKEELQIVKIRATTKI